MSAEPFGAADLGPPLRLAVFIPAYQAESTLEAVVRRIPGDVLDDLECVLVQDDASTDGTWAVAQGLEQLSGKIRCHRNATNLGFGGTHKRAFARLWDQGVDAFVVVHGDLQHPPELIGAMLAPIVAGDADIVLGSRMGSRHDRGGMPLHRVIANRVLTIRMNAVLNLRLTDYHTGFVALRSSVVPQVDLEELPDGHEFTAEILIRARHAGLRIVEVPVHTTYGDGTRSCSLADSARYAVHVLHLMHTEARSRRARE